MDETKQLKQEIEEMLEEVQAGCDRLMETYRRTERGIGRMERMIDEQHRRLERMREGLDVLYGPGMDPYRLSGLTPTVYEQSSGDTLRQRGLNAFND